MPIHGQRRILRGGNTKILALWCILILLLVITVVVTLTFYHRFCRPIVESAPSKPVVLQPHLALLGDKTSPDEKHYFSKKSQNNDEDSTFDISPSAPLVANDDKIGVSAAEQQQQPHRSVQEHSNFLLVKNVENKNKIYDFRPLKQPQHTIIAAVKNKSDEDRAIDSLVFYDADRSSDDNDPPPPSTTTPKRSDLESDQSVVLPSATTTGTEPDSVAMRRASAAKPRQSRDSPAGNKKFTLSDNGDDEGCDATAAVSPTSRRFIADETEKAPRRKPEEKMHASGPDAPHVSSRQQPSWASQTLQYEELPLTTADDTQYEEDSPQPLNIQDQTTKPLNPGRSISSNNNSSSGGGGGSLFTAMFSMRKSRNI